MKIKFIPDNEKELEKNNKSFGVIIFQDKNYSAYYYCNYIKYEDEICKTSILELYAVPIEYFETTLKLTNAIIREGLEVNNDIIHFGGYEYVMYENKIKFIED